MLKHSSGLRPPLLSATLLVCCLLLTAGCSKDMAEQMRKDEAQTAGTTEPAAAAPAVADRSTPPAEVAAPQPANPEPPATAPVAPADSRTATVPPAGVSNGPAGEQDPALQELHAVLEENIQRLKQGDAQGFLESILPPPQIAQLKQNQALFDAVVASLKANPARLNQIIEKLELMRQADITLNQTKSVAEFRQPQPIAGEKSSTATRAVRFELVNGVWRLHDQLQPTYDEISSQSKGAESIKLTPPVEGGGFGADLPAAIDQAIATLEEGDILTFVRNMFPAGAVRHPDADAQLVKISDRLKATPAPVERMIADLKVLRDLEPRMESDGSVAVYELPVPAGSIGSSSSEPLLRMYRLDGKWRMLKIGN